MRLIDRFLKSNILGEAVFGSMDGLVSVFGVIIGLAAASRMKIVDAAIGLAVASVVSMAFGEYLGDKTRSKKKALMMGAATLFGTLFPIVPLLIFPKIAGMVISGLLTIPFGLMVGAAQRKGRKGYIETFVMLYAAIVVTIIVSIFTGAGG